MMAVINLEEKVLGKARVIQQHCQPFFFYFLNKAHSSLKLHYSMFHVNSKMSHGSEHKKKKVFFLLTRTE